jgi:formylglycine-generating enzyme required for sulfatase activity
VNGRLGLANYGDPGTYEAGWLASYDTHVAPTSANLTNPSTCGAYATWTDSAGPNENEPINCVNWYESYAFCIWDGGFLPSQAEWEYAAAGGSEQREYPWGSTPPGSSYDYAVYDCNYPSSSLHLCENVSNIAPVGTALLGVGRWGQVDLVGELSQWTLDLFPECSDEGSPCINCAKLTGGSTRMIGGGIFNVSDPPYDELFPWTLQLTGPAYGENIAGIRCARVP